MKTEAMKTEALSRLRGAFSALSNVLRRRSSCVFCLAPEASYGCCAPCYADLPIIQRGCRLCAASLGGSKEWLDICADCLRRKDEPLIENAFSAFHYVHPLRKAFHHFKFNRQLYYAPVMGHLWLRAFHCRPPPFTPDLLLPVPLHPKRLRQRGFNPALELAKPLAAELGLELTDSICRRIRNTQPQTGCAHRRMNVRGAFAVTADLRHKSIAILDDVMTTGATLNELARVLKKAGAGHIAAWTLLRS